MTKLLLFLNYFGVGLYIAAEHSDGFWHKLFTFFFWPAEVLVELLEEYLF